MGELAEKSPDHTPQGRFVKGNKAHKPVRKRRAIKTLIADIADPEDLHQIMLNGVQEALKDPSGHWAMFFASKMVAPPKSVSPPIKLDLGATDDPVQMGKTIMHAVASGEVSPDTAQTLLQAMASLNSMVETAEMKAEMAELRQLLGQIR